VSEEPVRSAVRRRREITLSFMLLLPLLGDGFMRPPQRHLIESGRDLSRSARFRTLVCVYSVSMRVHWAYR
jgi:hypothetical protein